MRSNKSLIKRLIQAQKMLSTRIDISSNPTINNVEIVAAVDISYLNDLAFVVAVVWDIKLKSVVEILILRDFVTFPYIPTLLAFREARYVFRAYKHLIIRPELLLIDAHGIIHPRKVGCATHIGIVLNIPTIGVAKHGLIGRLKKVNENLARIEYKNELLGFALLHNNKPKVFVSPGNKIDPYQALDIVKRLITKHLLPEPLFIADKISKQIRKLFKQESYLSSPSL
ncbi:MAG: endonuclease V [Candidatus Asgardarchaeia archaeon]